MKCVSSLFLSLSLAYVPLSSSRPSFTPSSPPSFLSNPTTPYFFSPLYMNIFVSLFDYRAELETIATASNVFMSNSFNDSLLEVDNALRPLVCDGNYLLFTIQH